ncbi:hypothetical protein CMU71_03780 [Elizabethkingia anophelis]|nr:hypothetical protein C874_05080 [Elizabethkingia anophelis 502]MDV3566014.1 hypothetical protein [Elizabethkingia anophelis]MDV3876288.1 hypothetical protein [Elizabethkingia anophelis]MDV3971913.1 hypothetical protein [Elizabethkingia anophelis]
MKILKIITIISFLLVPAVDEKKMLNFMTILGSIYSYILRIFNPNLDKNPLWCMVAICVIGVLILFYKSKQYKDRYLTIFYFIVLALTSILYSNIIYNKPTLSFIIVFGIFIISSLIIIIQNFKISMKKD